MRAQLASRGILLGRWLLLAAVGACGSEAPGQSAAGQDAAADRAGPAEPQTMSDASGLADRALTADTGVPAIGDASPADRVGGGGTTGPGDGGADPALVARYIGVWLYLQGTETLECPGRANMVGDLTDAFLTFKAGTSAALEMASPTCQVNFAVEGDVASALPGQSCMSRSGGATLTYLIDSFTFTITGPGATATSRWTITFMDVQGTLRCSLMTTGQLARS